MIWYKGERGHAEGDRLITLIWGGGRPRATAGATEEAVRKCLIWLNVISVTQLINRVSLMEDRWSSLESWGFSLKKKRTFKCMWWKWYNVTSNILYETWKSLSWTQSWTWAWVDTCCTHDCYPFNKHVYDFVDTGLMLVETTISIIHCVTIIYWL